MIIFKIYANLFAGRNLTNPSLRKYDFIILDNEPRLKRILKHSINLLDAVLVIG